MFPIDIPPGTTLESLVTDVVPALHARFVGADAPAELFTIAVRIEGRGDWTVRVRGSAMTVDEGEADRPTLWMHTTARAVERFLEDALGPRRFLPKFAPVGGVTTMSDPRVLKRVAMASGRIELALADVDGERLAVTFGFGDAARKPIDPDDANVVVEARLETMERVLRGDLGPEEALADGDVTVKGNRFLAMQLALAVAPFYPARR
ncbi:MAG TPA: SCP2 sterol-binding domain-containing protein [Polyangiaceae bacterium]|jgi:putative sterol carrier protein|nr:SCP2 sterol-binding domain-containing protein [Polyangiaceae bacterium]